VHVKQELLNFVRKKRTKKNVSNLSSKNAKKNVSKKQNLKRKTNVSNWQKESAKETKK